MDETVPAADLFNRASEVKVSHGPEAHRHRPLAPTALQRSVSDYLAHVGARGLSPRTLDHYEGVLRKVFLPFLAEEGITVPDQITQRVLDRLSTRLLDEGGARGALSRRSVATYLRAIGHYLNWCRKEGELTTAAKPQP